MSDIRLHTLRSSRNRNTYARLDSNSAQHQPLHEPPSATTTTPTNTFASGSGSGSPMPMRASLNAAAASAVASSSRRKKGRRRHEYGEGEPEEEATLLGDSEHDPGFLPDDEEDRPIRAERAHDAASQVRARVATPSLPPYDDLTGPALSAIGVSEKVKRQITDCSLTTAR